MIAKRKSGFEAGLRSEYRPKDFAGMRAARGRVAKLLRRKSIVVSIAPDLTTAYPDERAVNDALRDLIQIRAILARKPVHRRRRAGR